MDRKTLWLRVAPHVVQKGHFVFSSGPHGDRHSNFVSGLLPHKTRSLLVEELCETASHMLGRWGNNSVIAGLGCGYWYAARVAEELGLPSVYAEKDTLGKLVFRRGQARFLKDKKVLLLDDVLSTGASMVRLGELAMECGADIVGALFILDRTSSPTTVNLELPNSQTLRSTVLFHQPMQMWSRADCPLCAKGIPFSTEYGAGREEFQRHGQPDPKL